MGLLKEGKISFSLWLNTNAGKLFLMQPPYSKDLRRRAMCPGIAVTFEIRSTLAKRGSSPFSLPPYPLPPNPFDACYAG